MPRFSTKRGAIYFEQHGARANPPVLLIHGLGCQLIHWPRSFIRGIVAAGFRVIAFDNRDVGLSFCVDVEPAAPERILAARDDPDSLVAPYTLSNMAEDAVALLDHLGQAGAHVVGVSMGAMIAQRMAIHHPTRAFTLTSIMSSTGDPMLPTPSDDILASLVASVVAGDKTDVVNNIIASYKRLGGPHHDSETVGLGRFAQAGHDRAYRPKGFLRQLTAMFTDGDRSSALRAVRTPTLVIHGDVDPLFPVAAGQHTSTAVPDAELRIVEKLGHDLPEPLIQTIVDSIVGLTRSVEVKR